MVSWKIKEMFYLKPFFTENNIKDIFAWKQ